MVHMDQKGLTWAAWGWKWLRQHWHENHTRSLKTRVNLNLYFCRTRGPFSSTFPQIPDWRSAEWTSAVENNPQKWHITHLYQLFLLHEKEGEKKNKKRLKACLACLFFVYFYVKSLRLYGALFQLPPIAVGILHWFQGGFGLHRQEKEQPWEIQTFPSKIFQHSHQFCN